MIIFTLQQLEDKKLPDIGKISSISFEYLVAGVACEYSKIKGFDHFETFKIANRLNWPLLLTYPFFVALSNGHSKSLYRLFGPFSTYAFGPASESIYRLMDAVEQNKADRLFKYFKNPKESSLKLDIANSQNYEGLKSFEVFQKMQGIMRMEELVLSKGVYKFEEISIESDKGGENPIFKAIDSSIKIISQQSHASFFDGDLRRIKMQASYFKAIQNSYLENKFSSIPYEKIEDPSRRPFYREDLVF